MPSQPKFFVLSDLEPLQASECLETFSPESFFNDHQVFSSHLEVATRAILAEVLDSTPIIEPIHNLVHVFLFLSPLLRSVDDYNNPAVSEAINEALELQKSNLSQATAIYYYIPVATHLPSYSGYLQLCKTRDGYSRTIFFSLAPTCTSLNENSVDLISLVPLHLQSRHLQVLLLSYNTLLGKMDLVTPAIRILPACVRPRSIKFPPTSRILCDTRHQHALAAILSVVYSTTGVNLSENTKAHTLSYLYHTEMLSLKDNISIFSKKVNKHFTNLPISYLPAPKTPLFAPHIAKSISKYIEAAYLQSFFYDLFSNYRPISEDEFTYNTFLKHVFDEMYSPAVVSFKMFKANSDIKMTQLYKLVMNLPEYLDPVSASILNPTQKTNISLHIKHSKLNLKNAHLPLPYAILRLFEKYDLETLTISSFANAILEIFRNLVFLPQNPQLKLEGFSSNQEYRHLFYYAFINSWPSVVRNMDQIFRRAKSSFVKSTAEGHMFLFLRQQTTMSPDILYVAHTELFSWIYSKCQPYLQAPRAFQNTPYAASSQVELPTTPASLKVALKDLIQDSSITPYLLNVLDDFCDRDLLSLPNDLPQVSVENGAAMSDEAARAEASEPVSVSSATEPSNSAAIAIEKQSERQETPATANDIDNAGPSISNPDSDDTAKIKIERDPETDHQNCAATNISSASESAVSYVVQESTVSSSGSRQRLGKKHLVRFLKELNSSSGNSQTTLSSFFKKIKVENSDI